MVTMMRLTAAFVASCTQQGRYGDGGGLYLQVTPVQGAGRASKRRAGVRQPVRKVAVTKQWLFRYQMAGKARAMGLGPVHTYSLAEAREAARKARQLVHQGIDPIDQRRDGHAARKVAEAKRLTFQQVAEHYIARHEGKWSPKHAKDWRASLASYVYPVLDGVDVGSVDTPLVIKVLDPHWQAKTDTMMKVRGRIEEVLDHAAVRHLRPAGSDNPARWKGLLDKTFPSRQEIAKTVHLAAMPYAAVPAFMAALRAVEGVPARALELTVLTAVRSGETLGARWSEVDLSSKVWTIPASRMKAKVDHAVPLSEEAVELLRSLPRIAGEDLVFPGGKRERPIGHSRMRETLQRLPGCAEFTVHGFRSAFRDWAGNETNFPREVAEQCLAHAVGDEVERAYRRGDALEKRRALMGAWARFCGGAEADGKVVPLHKAREAVQA
jgi:integrase